MSENMNTNNQDQLIEILNNTYNDNLLLINKFTDLINNLIERNTEVNNLIIQLLNNNSNTNISSRNNRTTGINNNRTTGINNNRTTGINNNRTTGINNNRTIGINNRNIANNTILNYRIPLLNINEQNRIINLPTYQNENTSEFFDPIIIFPTQTQIELATRNVIYSDIIEPTNISCPISLENFSDLDNVTMIRHCGHIFNREQLQIWFRCNSRCPICRYDIRGYNSTEFFQNSNAENNNLDISNNEINLQQNLERNTNTEPINLYEYLNSNYFDIILNDTSLFNDISNFNDITDPTFISSILNLLQRRK
jgi:hypothetical protein